MVIVKSGRRGFYSVILWYLDNCHRAEINDDDVMMNTFPDGYCDEKYHFYDKTSTCFLKYFEDPLNIDKNIKYTKDYSHLVTVENIMNYGNTQICGFILDVELRKYMNFLIKKYLKIRPHILEKISVHSKFFENKKVLGVHIRQTDLYTSEKDNKPVKPININTYIEKIKKNKFDLLYLMSDNIESINKIEKHFPNVYYIKDIIRSEKEKEQLFIRNEKLSVKKYKLGEDVLIETELLSKCNKILITNSNISSYVLANNPDIEYEYLDLKLKS